MRLYVRTGNVWSANFMEKIADKTGLKPAQVYKWLWDRVEMEKRQRLMLTRSKVLPDKIWHVTKVPRKRIDKVSLFLKSNSVSKLERLEYI